MFNIHDFNHFHFLNKTSSKIDFIYKPKIHFQEYLSLLENNLVDFNFSFKIFIDNDLYLSKHKDDNLIFIFHLFTENHTKSTIEINEFHKNIIHYTFNFSNQSINYHITLSNQQYLNYQHNFNDNLNHINYSYLIKNNVQLYNYQNATTQKIKNKSIFTLFEDSKINLNYFINTFEKQFHDDSIELIHLPNSSSEILYESINKGILNCQVNSIIPVLSNNCETHQKLKHLTLTPKSIVNAKPNLMIANPNTIASHGNSIGTINQDIIFYLMQKGLSKQQSLNTIVKSLENNFFNKINNHFPINEFMTWTYHD